MEARKLNLDAIKAIPIPATKDGATGSRWSLTRFSGATYDKVQAPRGFAVRTTAAGSKWYVLVYTEAGKEKIEPIGAVETVGLVEAIKIAARMRFMVDNDEPPVERAAKPAEVITVNQVLDEFLEAKAKKAGAGKGEFRSLAGYRRLANLHIRPQLGKRDIMELERGDIARWHRDITAATEGDSGDTTADRAARLLSAVVNWWRNFAPRGFHVDVFTRLEPRAPTAANARERYLEPDEIRQVWAAWDTMGTYGDICKFLLLTGERREEAAKMKWSEIKDGVWTLPVERMKAKAAHTVPLTPTLLALIERQPRRDDLPWVFLSATKRTPFSSFSHEKRKLDAAVRIPEWRVHDLRRTFVTLANSIEGVNADHVERTVAHTIKGVRGTYDRHHYDKQKLAVLMAVDRKVASILNPADGGNVVSLRGAAS